MKPVIAIVFVGIASLITPTASAGWSFSRWDQIDNSGTPANLNLTWNTFDLYLKADSPMDTIVFVDASENLGNSLTVDAGAFYQHPIGNTLGAPSDGFIFQFPDVEFDTYLAIGESTDLATATAPSFFSNGNNVNGSWFVSPPAPGVSPTQNPVTLDWEIFVGRFTVDTNATSLGGLIDVGGTVVIPIGSRGVANSQDLIPIPNAVPTPTALAPLVFAFFASRRRRRLQA